MNIPNSNIPIVNPMIEDEDSSDNLDDHQSSDLNSTKPNSDENWKQPPVLLEYSLKSK